MQFADIEKYKELLEKVASGASDSWGYCNLRNKVLAGIDEAVTKYRDDIVAKGRYDKFVLPDHPENIELVHSHMAKPEWKEHLQARFVPKKYLDIECDMYLWDDQVGICTFEGSTVKVIYYSEPSTVELYRSMLITMWSIGMEEHMYFGPRASEMTMLEKEVYLSPKDITDLAVGYPKAVTPDWIRDYQQNILQEKYFEQRANDLISNLENYFKNLFKSPRALLTPSSTYGFSISIDALIDTAGGEVIVTDPGYDSYPNIIRSFGGSVIQAKRSSDFEIDVDDIASKVSSRTIAVVVCLPENPFGVIHSRSSLEKLVQLCLEHSITLVIDYCFYQLSPFNNPIPLLTEMLGIENLSYILIGDTGKILDLQGSKLGALLYSENMSKRLLSKASNYFFQLNQFDLWLISKIVTDERFPRYLADLNGLIKKNYLALQISLSPKLSLLPLQASSVCLIDISQTGIEDIEFCQILKMRFAIAAVPASYFFSGAQGVEHRYVRLALARDERVIENAARKIRVFVEELTR